MTDANVDAYSEELLNEPEIPFSIIEKQRDEETGKRVFEFHFKAPNGKRIFDKLTAENATQAKERVIELINQLREDIKNSPEDYEDAKFGMSGKA